QSPRLLISERGVIPGTRALAALTVAFLQPSKSKRLEAQKHMSFDQRTFGTDGSRTTWPQTMTAVIWCGGNDSDQAAFQ
ncbi:MAG: hypothetical protein JSW48_01405, partial [Betaproteobacteria bacterium]